MEFTLVDGLRTLKFDLVLTLGLAASMLLLIVASGSGAWLLRTHRAEVMRQRQLLNSLAVRVSQRQ